MLSSIFLRNIHFFNLIYLNIISPFRQTKCNYSAMFGVKFSDSFKDNIVMSDKQVFSWPPHPPPFPVTCEMTALYRKKLVGGGEFVQTTQYNAQELF